jgi:hypothetical protein
VGGIQNGTFQELRATSKENTSLHPHISFSNTGALKMEESELEQDIVIQRYSADLIADFDRSLEPFLKKPNGQLRTRVRERETSRLVSQVGVIRSKSSVSRYSPDM